MKKLLLPITLLSTIFITANAQTTMCFKQNHKDFTTIENTKLNGGECLSANSLNDMKAKGWKVDDIKITANQDGTNNFVYILKKGNSSTNFANYNSGISQEELEQNIMKKLVKQKKQNEEKLKKEKFEASINRGKNLYISKCLSCHGTKGEKAAYAISTPLNKLSEDDMINAINSYTNDDSYGKGYQILMKSISANITEHKVIDIYNYLKSISK